VTASDHQGLSPYHRPASYETLKPWISEKGWPAEPVRFMIGMFLLKHTYGLSDKQLWGRWVQAPISSTSPATTSSNTS
jgi:hypothetical protein